MAKSIASKIFLIVVGAMLLATSAQAVTTEKDGIELNVTITRDEGKTLVSSVLANRSEFPICSASVRYKQVFYAKLADADGNVLPQDAKWAQSHAQKSSRRYHLPRTFTVFQINPGESLNWDFHLEDAYPASSIGQGEKLELSWESQYFGIKSDLDENPYRFAPDWKTSVTMPLAKAGIGPVPEGGVGEAGESSMSHAEDIPQTRPEVKEAHHENEENRRSLTILGMVLAAILIAILLKFCIGRSAR